MPVPRLFAGTAIAAAAVLAISGCANKATSGSSGSAVKAAAGSPSVTIMVGGLSKQIYLPYMLAQDLGYYAKAGVNVKLENEPAGGDATQNMLAGQVDGVGGFYDHNIALQGQGKSSESVVSMLQVPGEVELCRTDLQGHRSARRRPGRGCRWASPTPVRRPTS